MSRHGTEPIGEIPGGSAGKSGPREELIDHRDRAGTFEVDGCRSGGEGIRVIA